jgi:hypothetical protein
MEYTAAHRFLDHRHAQASGQLHSAQGAPMQHNLRVGQLLSRACAPQFRDRCGCTFGPTVKSGLFRAK